MQAEAATAVVDSYKANRRLTVRGKATVADGIAVGTPGRLTLPLVTRYVDELVVVEEEEITQAMMLLLERGKLLVEGAGAVGLRRRVGRQGPGRPGRRWRWSSAAATWMRT